MNNKKFNITNNDNNLYRIISIKIFESSFSVLIGVIKYLYLYNIKSNIVSIVFWDFKSNSSTPFTSFSISLVSTKKVCVSVNLEFFYKISLFFINLKYFFKIFFISCVKVSFKCEKNS